MNELLDDDASKKVQADWKNRPVLITGATGFVGANLVRKLQGLQAKVHVMLRSNSSTWRIDDCRSELTIAQGDLSHYKDVQHVIEMTRPEVIFHLATARGTQDKSRLRYVETNVLGVAHLLECMDHLPATRLILAGSSLEYAPSEWPIPESHPLIPNTLHGAVKLAAGMLAKQAAQAENFAISQLRIFHVYGPWESAHRFLPQAILHAIEGRPMPLVEGLSRRDWVHVDDVVRALLIAASPDSPLGIFNIGSGTEHSNEEVMTTLESVLSRPITRQVAGLPRRATDSEHRCANIELAASALGWKPRLSLAQGIQKTLVWRESFPDVWRMQHGDAPTTH
jgi:nucleoside-diphosphate-sugar epimerase